MDYDKNKEVIVKTQRDLRPLNFYPGAVAVIESNEVFGIDIDQCVVVRKNYAPNIKIFDAPVDIFTEEDSTPIITNFNRDKTQIHAKGNSRVTLMADIDVSTKITIEENARVWCASGNVLPKIYYGTLTNVTNAKEWCEFYNVPIINGIALLGKGVRSDCKSIKVNPYTLAPVKYTPGTIPVADDWDGGVKECGQGLHFSPNIRMVEHFIYPWRRLICPVRLEDISVHPNGEFPYKCKAKGCCEPVWEVDAEGTPIDERSTEIRDAFFKKHS